MILLGIVFFLLIFLAMIVLIHRLHVKKIERNQETHRRWLIDITSQMNLDERTNDEIFNALLQNQSDFNDILEEQFT